jgi:UDP-N-acetylmuramate dehydrogenase
MNGAETWQVELRRGFTGEIRFGDQARHHTSIRVGGTIDALIFPKSEAELAEAVGLMRAAGIPYLPVGNWTNLIVTDGGYRGALISLTGLRRLNRTDREDGAVQLEAQAGIPLAELVSLSVREALTGMEFCAGIPGSVGGAVRMNAGAYGGEMKDICTAVRLLDPAGGIRTIPRGELTFTYRNLDLSAETIIIGAVFKLGRGDGQAVAGRVREIIETRRGKHPLEMPNAGSIFKNPKALAAGKLIEQAGLKGLTIGGAQVSEKHGNFIVNRGAASAAQILELIALVQKRVFEATGQALETEVKIIGT